MTRANRLYRPEPIDRALRTGVVLSVVAAIVGAVSWAVLHPPYEPRPAASRPAVDASYAEQAPTPRRESAPRRQSAPGQQSAGQHPAEPAPTIVTPPRPRSPLERSPGYVPPADPESLSVITGRRDAPAVDLPLTGGASSLEDLTRLFLASLQARDERAMHALRVTRREFEVICWPEFPESRPITRITADDAWQLSEPTSLAGAGRAIALYGGQDLVLVRAMADERQSFRNFTLHRGFVIVVKDASGVERSLRVAPSIVERRGRFKALLFKD